MKIGVVLITYAIDVTPLIKSMDGPDVSWRIFTHSANQEVIAALNFIPVRSDMRPDIKLYDYRQNRGLAKSWNEGLIDAYAMGADAVIGLRFDATEAGAQTPATEVLAYGTAVKLA